MQNIYIFFHKITGFPFFVFAFYFLAEETIHLPGFCMRFCRGKCNIKTMQYVKKCKNLVQAWHAHRPCLNSPAAFDNNKGQLFFFIIFYCMFWGMRIYITASTTHTYTVCHSCAPVFLATIFANYNEKWVTWIISVIFFMHKSSLMSV